ncbi:MAG: hypothetical protein ACI9CF_000569, partial [Candidatus Omnitrophota bacterium]
QQENQQMQLDIIEMAEEHEKILGGLLDDHEIKDQVQKKIGLILDRYKD